LLDGEGFCGVVALDEVYDFRLVAVQAEGEKGFTDLFSDEGVGVSGLSYELAEYKIHLAIQHPLQLIGHLIQRYHGIFGQTGPGTLHQLQYILHNRMHIGRHNQLRMILNNPPEPIERLEPNLPLLRLQLLEYDFELPLAMLKGQ
jgi:hypothetical protein